MRKWRAESPSFLKVATPMAIIPARNKGTGKLNGRIVSVLYSATGPNKTMVLASGMAATMRG